jgi:hypothetical protein
VTVFVVVLVRKQSASSEVSAIVRYGIYNKTRKWFHLEKNEYVKYAHRKLPFGPSSFLVRSERSFGMF